MAEPEVERVVARLVELALLDDRTFAQHYVERRAATRGRLALRAELRRKGVAQDLIDDALGSEGEEAQTAAATALLRKQAWRFVAATGPDRAEAAQARARAYALLARRGFPPDAVRAAVDEALPADDDA